MKAHPKERGSTLAWTAVFLAAVLLPLITLAADGARLYLVYTRLGAATDIACAELGYVLTDRQHFIQNGQTRMVAKPWINIAIGNFAQSLANLNIGVTNSPQNFNFSLNGNTINCTGRATFPLLTIPGRQITIQQYSTNRVRFIVPAP